MSGHFSAVVFVSKEGSKPRVLVQPYLYRGRLQIKFPGGTNDGHPGENPEVTGIREFLEETSLLLNCTPILIHKEQVSPDHTKYFFLADNAEGEARTKVKRDDGEEDLLPSERREVNENLVREMFPSHRPALLKAIAHKAQEDPDWGWSYQRLAHLF